MNNISEIQIGGLYHIPHYVMAMYDIVDPKQQKPARSMSPPLEPNTPFVPLELYTVNIAIIGNNTVHRLKILTTTGEVGWLSLQDSELPYVFPMTSCDKQL